MQRTDFEMCNPPAVPCTVLTGESIPRPFVGPTMLLKLSVNAEKTCQRTQHDVVRLVLLLLSQTTVIENLQFVTAASSLKPITTISLEILSSALATSATVHNLAATAALVLMGAMIVSMVPPVWTIILC